MNRLARILAALVLTALAGGPVHAQRPIDSGLNDSQGERFTYMPPGALLQGTGEGVQDARNYWPDLRFPMETGPAYLNSQVFRYGGRLCRANRRGPDGTPLGPDCSRRNQCDSRNFAYPWQDTFCERRAWGNPECASERGHQGVDIRARTCADRTHWVVAVADGRVVRAPTAGKWPHVVKIRSADETALFTYAHLADVQVVIGQDVKKGERIGRLSNIGRTGRPATTRHLHFEISKVAEGVRLRPNPYMTLVTSYIDLLKKAPPEPAISSLQGVREPHVDRSGYRLRR